MPFTIKEFLALEVRPALGCTEPVAVALGAAAAAELLPAGSIDDISLKVDRNVFKNGRAVTIPGTGGFTGLQLAAALGAVLGRPELGMEVLGSVTRDSLEQAQSLVQSGRVSLQICDHCQGLFIESLVQAGGHSASSIIQGAHDNIVQLTLDGRELQEHPLLTAGQTSGGSIVDLESWLRERSLADLIELSMGLDAEDEAFVQRGMDMNEALARSGLENGSGLGVGRSLSRLAEQGQLQMDMLLAAKILTASAADARMAGADLPAMSSAGSGNNGLTAILPLRAVLDYLDCPRQRYLQAVALSHLVTALIKTHTGKLSAVCSCSIAAGAGAAAGIVHILGGGRTEIGAAVCNLIGDLGGVLCDGAKSSCALKLATASGSAVQAALLAMQAVSIPAQDGIIGPTPEQTIANLGQISRQGMSRTDQTIVNILLDKRIIPQNPDKGAEEA